MMLRVLFALAVVACAVPALAQQPVQFVPRYEFHMGAEHLSGDNPRYVWDADFGGAMDVVDYGLGRFTFWANYNVVMGEQLRMFDPNSGNYILAGSTSARLPGVEVAGVFYHQSRHLSDRVKRQPVDWNMAGGRVAGGLTSGRLQVEGRADLRGVVQKSLVDYRWELDTEARSRVALRASGSGRLALIAAGGVRVLGVDGSRGRGTQNGFRGEAGVRVEGSGAAVELFVAAERRIDPYPLEFSTESWVTAGFRLLSR